MNRQYNKERQIPLHLNATAHFYQHVCAAYNARVTAVLYSMLVRYALICWDHTCNIGPPCRGAAQCTLGGPASSSQRCRWRPGPQGRPVPPLVASVLAYHSPFTRGTCTLLRPWCALMCLIVHWWINTYTHIRYYTQCKIIIIMLDGLRNCVLQGTQSVSQLYYSSP